MVALVNQNWNPQQTIKGMYQSIWTILYEVILFQKYDAETCKSYISDAEDLFEYCDEIAPDKGIIFASCHTGNWEIGSRIISRYYRPISSVFKPHKKQWINNLLLSIRNQHRQTTIPKEGGLLPLMRKLKQKEAIGLLIDQNGGEDGVESEFLGQPCKSWDSIIQLANRTKCPVVPIIFIRNKDKICCHFIKNFKLSYQNDELNIEKSVKDLDQALSELISLAPDQWLWLGRKWGRDFKNKMNKA
jgi:KDO2-lipid IV(A) lauroyltransferase